MWVIHVYEMNELRRFALQNMIVTAGLNPIEHAWDMLQTASTARPVQPITIPELRQALLEEWVRPLTILDL